MKKTINTIKVKISQFFGVSHSKTYDEASGGHPCRVVGGSYC